MCLQTQLERLLHCPKQELGDYISVKKEKKKGEGRKEEKWMEETRPQINFWLYGLGVTSLARGSHYEMSM